MKKESRFRISWREFEEIVSKNGLSSQAEEICQKLQDEGKVLHLKQASANFVYIDLPTISTALNQVLDPSGLTQSRIVAEKKSRLGELAKEFEQLERQYQIIDGEAGKSSKRIIWTMVTYLTLQTVVVTRLTFWDLSWDIMEPITYIGSFAIGAVGLFFFGLTRTNPDYNGVYGIFKERKKRKLFVKYNFDLKRYLDLRNTLEANKRDLQLWGETEILQHLKH